MKIHKYMYRRIYETAFHPCRHTRAKRYSADILFLFTVCMTNVMTSRLIVTHTTRMQGEWKSKKIITFFQFNQTEDRKIKVTNNNSRMIIRI